MKEVKRIDKTYRLNELPKLKNNSFIMGKQRGYTGSIISRSMQKTAGIYKHYGFIYGFDERNTLWIIENILNGVECVTMRDFMAGNSNYKVILNTDPSSCTAIMERAKEKAEEIYRTRENNCETFVNYSRYGKLESRQVSNTEKLANLTLTFVEAYYNTSNDSIAHDFIDTLNDIRKSINLPREKSIQEAFDKKKKLVIASEIKKIKTQKPQTKPDSNGKPAAR